MNIETRRGDPQTGKTTWALTQAHAAVASGRRVIFIVDRVEQALWLQKSRKIIDPEIKFYSYSYLERTGFDPLAEALSFCGREIVVVMDCMPDCDIAPVEAVLQVKGVDFFFYTEATQ